MPDQWEKTTYEKCSVGWEGCKDIVSGKPFLFYFLDDEIQIIKHKDDQIPLMVSDKNWLMGFGWGLNIRTDQNKESEA